jgi:nucleoside-diphosphate-sugar epimerase
MNVLVTGGIGTVGKALLERLLHNGHTVRVVDRRTDFTGEDIDYRVGDITNYDEMRKVVRGCQAIIHLAAIANPMMVPPQEIFRVNVQGTYNVYEAAAAEGIRRVVQASSINAFGCFWGNRDIQPDYFPLDEAHPTATTDVYSFSKEVVEDIGDYYWRRKGISGVSMRFPGVWTQPRIHNEERKAQRERTRAALDEFAALPPGEREQRLAAIRRAALAFRAAGNMEYPAAQQGLARSGFSDDPLWPAYTFDRFNFWAYVDERDSAQSLEKGVMANYTGHYPLFINADNNSLGYPTVKLARLLFPEVTVWKRPLVGDASLVNTEKARALIGYASEHTL